MPLTVNFQPQLGPQDTQQNFQKPQVVSFYLSFSIFVSQVSLSLPSSNSPFHSPLPSSPNNYLDSYFPEENWSEP